MKAKSFVKREAMSMVTEERLRSQQRCSFRHRHGQDADRLSAATSALVSALRRIGSLAPSRVRMHENRLRRPKNWVLNGFELGSFSSGFVENKGSNWLRFVI